MKFSIRVTLIVFLIFLFLNSCASTKKNTDESLTDIQTEDTDTADRTAEASKDAKKVTDAEIIILTIPEKSQKEQAILPKQIGDSNLHKKDTELKSASEPVKSVSDPKPITDQPALELIINGEDEASNNEDFELSSPLESPSVPDKPLISVPDKKQIVKPADDLNKTAKPEIKEEPLEKNGTSSDTAPSVAETEPPVTKAESPIAEVMPTISEVSGVNDEDIINEKKIKDSEPARIFSEFPSTEPDESKEERASRSVKLYTGQRLEVVYPGEGWVYLGESSAQKGIKYQQRKLQNGTSTFHFGAISEGSYILNFSHFDVFSDNFISDSIAVHVEKAKTKLSDTVKAPDYKGALNTAKEIERKKSSMDEKNKGSLEGKSAREEELLSPPLTVSASGTPLKPESSSKKDENEKVYDSPDLLTVSEKPASKTSVKESKSASDLLDMIRGYISEGNSAEALNSADNFFKNYSVNLDEALFLRGQAYELNGPNKNVKKAFEAYQTLIKAYPESKFWEKADARIRYIKKFYIDIK